MKNFFLLINFSISLIPFRFPWVMSTKYMLAVSWLGSILGWRKRKLSYCEYLGYGRGSDTSNSLLEKVICFHKKCYLWTLWTHWLCHYHIIIRRLREPLISLFRIYQLPKNRKRLKQICSQSCCNRILLGVHFWTVTASLCKNCVAMSRDSGCCVLDLKNHAKWKHVWFLSFR